MTILDLFCLLYIVVAFILLIVFIVNDNKNK